MRRRVLGRGGQQDRRENSEARSINPKSTDPRGGCRAGPVGPGMPDKQASCATTSRLGSISSWGGWNAMGGPIAALSAPNRQTSGRKSWRAFGEFVSSIRFAFCIVRCCMTDVVPPAVIVVLRFPMDNTPTQQDLVPTYSTCIRQQRRKMSPCPDGDKVLILNTSRDCAPMRLEIRD